MFTTLIVQPIFNVLVLIYALLPGHNFGVAIILFTLLVRMALYPLLKRQLHHARAMRALAPELKKIKAAAKGDKQKQSMLTMELYKERQINPFASLGLVLVQIPILIGLYIGLQKIIKNPHAIINLAYPPLQHLSWMKELAADITKFDNTLFGVINLGRPALGPMGVYVPALILCAGSAFMQYYQSKMLMPKSEDSRSLRTILKEAGKGKQADQSEVSMAVGRGTLIFIPAIVFLVSMQLAAALPLYWFTSSLIASLQQRRILAQDLTEAKAIVTKVTTRTMSDDEAKPQPKQIAKKSGHKKRAKKRRRK